MNPITLAVLAVVLYGASNTVIENYLKKRIDPLAMIIVMTASLLIFALLVRVFGPKPEEHFNTDWKVGGTCVILGIVLFFADYCFLSAYQRGGNGFAVTSVLLLIPVIVGAAHAALTGKLPDLRQWLAFGLIAAALFLLRK